MLPTSMSLTMRLCSSTSHLLKSQATRALATVTSPSASSLAASSVTSTSTPRGSAVTLELKSGEKFRGKSFGAARSVSGELVFTTSLVGYPESMTDPSYRGQIIVFTQPLIGNYGVPGMDRDQFGLLKHFESERIQVSGIIVSNYSAKYSHWTAVESLAQWCIRHDVPAFSDVDTRALTKLLRDRGSSLGRMVCNKEEAVPFIDPNSEVNPPHKTTFACFLSFFLG